MLAGAIEASRAWGIGLNRLGWGCISAFLLSSALGLSEHFRSTFNGSEGFTLSTLVGAIFLLLLSGLVGSMAITLGSVTDTSPFNLKKRTDLAERVGRTGNVLLIQIYGDAALRYEMATGVRGTLYFGLFSAVIGWSTGKLDSVSMQPITESTWPAIAGAAIALLFDFVLSRTSTESFQALEQVVAKTEERTGAQGGTS